MLNLLVGYWPLWLLAAVLLGFAALALGAGRMAGLADRELYDAAAAERAAARAGRPSPAPIDVELMRR